LLGVIAPGASVFSLLIIKPYSYTKTFLPKAASSALISLIKTEKICILYYLENISKIIALTR
jgi:hypothetical protein